MNKTLALTLFCVLFASATAMYDDQARYTIDSAANALEDLLDEANQNLADLQANWALNEPILQANIDAVSQQLQNKQAECQTLDGVLAADQAELDNARRYVAWLVRRIQENQDHIANLLAERCQQSQVHVEALKNDKIALSLVQFLRVQVQNKESFDFAQRKSFLNKLQSFLAVYRRGNLSELIQLQKQVAADWAVDSDTSVHGRNDEEIGHGHVDNDVSELNLDGFQGAARQNWGDVRAELLEILDELEQTITEKINNSQEDEVRSASAAADLKRRLEHEIEVYQQELARWTDKVTALENLVAKDQVNVDTCRSEEHDLEAQLEQAETDLQEATDQFNHKQSNFEEEVALFQEVLEIYHPTTQQGDDFKARTDDYLDDGTFNNGDYDDREVPDIQLLNN